MTRNELYVSEGIDRIITIDLGARGVIYRLYEAARQLVEEPLTLKASKALVSRLREGDYVIVATGFRVPPNFIQETDGPLGAVTLSVGLVESLKVRPTIIIESDSMNIMREILERIGYSDKIILEDYPVEHEDAYNKAGEIIEKYSPSAFITIEKAGRNVKGVYHNMRGLNVSDYHSKIEILLEEIRKYNALTIAVGDGGNEVGMGNIRDIIVKYVPYGDRCQCPCGAGIAAESKVDILVTSAVSNWGAYGIEAMLAYLTDSKNALHTPDMEEEILRASIDAGAVDGVLGERKMCVDGIEVRYHKEIVDLLNKIIG